MLSKLLFSKQSYFDYYSSMRNTAIIPKKTHLHLNHDSKPLKFLHLSNMKTLKTAPYYVSNQYYFSFTKEDENDMKHTTWRSFCSIVFARGKWVLHLADDGLQETTWENWDPQYNNALKELKNKLKEKDNT